MEECKATVCYHLVVDKNTRNEQHFYYNMFGYRIFWDESQSMWVEFPSKYPRGTGRIKIVHQIVEEPVQFPPIKDLFLRYDIPIIIPIAPKEEDGQGKKDVFPGPVKF